MQRDEVIWRDGKVPQSTRFNDPYYSLHDGLAEARHVFLAGNRLPERFCDGFSIAELGFGTGLNALAALDAWRGDGVFHFTSFEAFPMAVQDMAQALSAWPDLEAAALVKKWGDGEREFEIGAMKLKVIEGDARETVPRWIGKADAWFLDGFAPSRNPELWTAELMRSVAQHTHEGGTCATYSAAGHIRHKLEDAGFRVERLKGFGHKRHMTVGRI